MPACSGLFYKLFVNNIEVSIFMRYRMTYNLRLLILHCPVLMLFAVLLRRSFVAEISMLNFTFGSEKCEHRCLSVYCL